MLATRQLKIQMKGAAAYVLLLRTIGAEPLVSSPSLLDISSKDRLLPIDESIISFSSRLDDSDPPSWRCRGGYGFRDRTQLGIMRPLFGLDIGLDLRKLTREKHGEAKKWRCRVVSAFVGEEEDRRMTHAKRGRGRLLKYFLRGPQIQVDAEGRSTKHSMYYLLAKQIQVLLVCIT